MILIGDCHGKTEQLCQLVNGIAEDKKIYQLGDMGLGFKGVFLPQLGERFKFIRGNHDNPEMCKEHPNYLGEFGYVPEKKMFYVGGAWSIDWQWRKPGVSWWYDEQLSPEQLEAAFQLYMKTKPEIVISHECPFEAGKILLAGMTGEYFAAKSECFKSATSRELQRMFDAWKPKRWIFGHYHVDKEFELEGTTFRCCAELSTYEG